MSFENAWENCIRIDTERQTCMKRVVRLFLAWCALTGIGAVPSVEIHAAQRQAGIASAEVTSRIRVLVPQDDAELQFEGRVIEGTGAVREFDTPPLVAGRTYQY